MEFDPSDPINPEVQEMAAIKAKKTAGSFGFSRSDSEDIAQELALNVFVNARKLVARSASQKTVLDRAMRNRISHMIDAQVAKKRDRRRDTDIDGAPPSALMDGEHEVDVLIGRLDLSAAISSMPPELRQIALALQESTPAEVARELKLTRGQLRHRMEQIEQHLRAHGLGPAQPD